MIVLSVLWGLFLIHENISSLMSERCVVLETVK